MYASKTPRDLNNDPLPYVGVTDMGPFRTSKGSTLRDESDTYDPRPEFDHVQHNSPNPILVEFRVLHQATGNDLFSDALMFTSDLMEEFVEREPEHWDHAMRVLTRVLHFSKMTRGTR